MASSTLRISPELRARAVQHAEQLGISFNALVAVALSDYLEQRAAATDLPGVAPGRRAVGRKAAKKAGRR